VQLENTAIPNSPNLPPYLQDEIERFVEQASDVLLSLDYRFVAVDLEAAMRMVKRYRLSKGQHLKQLLQRTSDEEFAKDVLRVISRLQERSCIIGWVAAQYNRSHANEIEGEILSSRRVGAILRKLGFDITHKRAGNFVEFTHEKNRKLAVGFFRAHGLEYNRFPFDTSIRE
jgi:hypothetical protein